MALPVTEERPRPRCAVARGTAGRRPGLYGQTEADNLLVADRGYDGFILKAVSGLNSLRAEGNTIAAGSGVLLSRLASFAMEQGLSSGTGVCPWHSRLARRRRHHGRGGL
ncbi:MAG: hypothetical protein ACLSAF_17095 [Intestinimonas sp.]